MTDHIEHLDDGTAEPAKPTPAAFSSLAKALVKRPLHGDYSRTAAAARTAMRSKLQRLVDENGEVKE